MLVNLGKTGANYFPEINKFLEDENLEKGFRAVAAIKLVFQ